MPRTKVQTRDAKWTASRRYVKRAIDRIRDKQETVVNNAAENAAYDGEAVQLLTSASAAGTKEQIAKVDTRFRFKAQAAAGATFVRCIIFQWFADSASESPAFADLFENGTPAASSILDPIQNISEDNSVKLKVLKDFMVRLGENTAVDGTDSVVRRVIVTPKMLQRKYLKGTGSGTGFNNVYLLAISDIADASSPPTVESRGMYHYKLEA